MTEVEAESETKKERKTGRIRGTFSYFKMKESEIHELKLSLITLVNGQLPHGLYHLQYASCRRKLVPRDSWTAVCMPETARVRKITIGTETT